MNKLTELYKVLIKSLGWTVMADGRIGLTTGEDTTEIVEEGMYWVFPDTQYRPPEEPWLLFHPAIETGQAAVIEKIRTRMQTLLVTRTLYLIIHMVLYATSEVNQEKISAKQADLLRVLEDADSNTGTNLSRLITEIHRRFTNAKQSELKYSFLTLYMRNGGRIGNNTYSRVAALSSKFYELLLDSRGDPLFEPGKVLGVKLRKADVNLIKKVIGWIFPMIDKPGPESRWNAGSHTDHGAGFYTLTEMYVRAMERLASVADTISLKDGDGIQQQMRFDLRSAISASIEDPADFTKVPSRLAMEGRVASNLVQPKKAVEYSTRVNTAAAPPPQAAVAEKVTSVKKGGSVTYSEWLAAHGGRAIPQSQATPNQAGVVGATRLVVLGDGKSVVVDANGTVVAGLGQAVATAPQQQQPPVYTGPTPVGDPVQDQADGRYYFPMSDRTFQLAVMHNGKLYPEGMLRAMSQQQQRSGPRANASGGYGGYQPPAQQPYGGVQQQPYGGAQQPQPTGFAGRMRPTLR